MHKRFKFDDFMEKVAMNHATCLRMRMNLLHMEMIKFSSSHRTTQTIILDQK